MSRKILIVDDSPDLRVLVRQLLENEGYAVETAENGKEAFNILLPGIEPDLILLDHEMPAMDGSAFIDELERLNILSHVPIVMLTAKEVFRNNRIATFIRKPFDLFDLADTVNRLCDQSLAGRLPQL